MAELLLKECMEKAQTESNLSITNTNDDMNIELSKEFLTELQSNAYHKKFDEDIVDHIAKVSTSEMVKSPPEEYLRPGYYELMAWLDSRHDDMRVDRKTALCHYWIYGWGNNESSDDIVSSDDEWEEYEYGNPSDTTTKSFFKPYMKTQEKNNIKEKMNEARLSANTTIHPILMMSNLTKGCAKQKTLK
ncbi:hypothetical protein Tco_0545985 [Tanacetum coccineum]